MIMVILDLGEARADEDIGQYFEGRGFVSNWLTVSLPSNAWLGALPPDSSPQRFAEELADVAATRSWPVSGIFVFETGQAGASDVGRARGRLS